MLWDSNECEEVFESGESCAVAVLAEGAGGGFAVHQDVEGEAAQSGDDARVGSDPGSILGEGDVSDIVGGIFDAPMCADGLGGDGGGERCVGDVEGGVVCQLEQAGFGIAGGDCAFDLNDGGDMGMPVGAGERAGGIEDGDGAGFVTIAAAVAGPEDVVWGARCGDMVDRLLQRRLIVLDLDDEADVARLGDVEGFFWQCRASRVTSVSLAMPSSASSAWAAGISLDFSPISAFPSSACRKCR